MKLAIVIVHYNTSGDLERCLESLAANAPAAPHRVVVVDNASRDDGLADVHRRFPDCTWIFNTENAGYAKGCNQGIAAVDAAYHLLLNPDVVALPGPLDALLAFADAHPRAGIVGPQLLNEDGSIQDSCRRFYTFRTLLLRRTFFGKLFPDSETVRRHLMRDFDHRAARPVDWILGGCLLARREAVARTGAMDERFFLYFEDVDWCYRMWQAGFEVVYSPEARFIHRHRRASAKGTFNRSFFLHLASLISFYEKWGMLVWLLKKWREPLLLGVLWLLDMAGLTVAFGLAYGLRSLLGSRFAEPLYPFAEYRPLLLFALVLATVTFLSAGRYKPGRLRDRRGLGEHLQHVGVVSVLLLAATYLGHMDVISRAVLLLFIPLLAVLTAVGDRAVAAVRRRLERGRLSLERTLLVGDTVELNRWLLGAGDLARQGVDVAGYLADPGDIGVLPPLQGGVPWLGRPDEAGAVVERYRISQVVFGAPPAAGRTPWLLLGTLRRLRVRLRWLGEGTWLLAAAARAETFGGVPSAVQAVGGRRAASAGLRRMRDVAAGLLLAVFTAGPRLVHRAGALRRGDAVQQTVPVCDAWGRALELTLVTGRDGRVLALPWQAPLAGALLRGRVGVWGARGERGAVPGTPRDAASVFAFWHDEPAPPGLVGPWAAGEGRGAAARVLGRLWRDPCGFGNLGGVSGQDASTAPAGARREEKG
ncbi:MAG TPA: glycosyltransferase [Candidatus Krumholzibacteria bacterium]|nr:glycosyltransferase [Candidatus Krumholzibacteria bacterium]